MPKLSFKNTCPENERALARAVLFSPENYLQTVLTELIARTGAVHGSLEAFNIAVSRHPSGAFGDGAISALPQHALPNSSSSRHANPLTFAIRPTERFSVSYDGNHTGTLVLAFPDSAAKYTALQNRSALSRDLRLWLTRPILRRRISEALDTDLTFHGNSSALSALEGDIEKVSATQYPVVLLAGFGASDIEVAAAIHFRGERSEEAFIVFHCASFSIAEFNHRLGHAWDRAIGGSLLLSGVDLLDQEMQRLLLWKLRHGREAQHEGIRILVSTGTSLAALEGEGRFCRMLRAELEVLQIRIPLMRERKVDIRPILEHCLERHARPLPKRLTNEAWHACLQYDWPENEAEIERLAIRLAVMAETDEIDIKELKNAGPWLPVPSNAGIRAEGESVAPESSATAFDDQGDDFVDRDEPSDSGQPEAGEGGSPRSEYLASLVRQLVAQDFRGLEKFVPGMQRALRFLGTHFHEEITLPQLAREAYISISHLSFLFKRDLGLPFKSLLAAVRIEKARQLLLENHQQSITEICLDTGFGDLSHFERTFKRLVGTSPRHFRRSAAGTSRPIAKLSRHPMEFRRGYISVLGDEGCDPAMQVAPQTA